MNRELEILFYKIGFWSLPAMCLVILAFEWWKLRLYTGQRTWLRAYMANESKERREFEKTVRDHAQLTVIMLEIAKKYFELIADERGETKEALTKEHVATQHHIDVKAEEIKREVNSAAQKVLSDSLPPPADGNFPPQP